MKKVALLLLLIAFAIGAKAQMYGGGTIGFGVASVKPDGGKSVNTTTFQIAPELGYNFNDTWAVGASVGYGLQSSGVACHSVMVLPYVRGTFARSGVFSFFGELALGYEYQAVEGNGASGFVGAIRPGFSAELTDNCALVARTSLLQFEKFNGVSGVGFAINNGVEIGLEFKF